VIAAGLATGVVFVRRQRTLADPLLDLGLFAERRFSVSLGVLTLSAAVMGGWDTSPPSTCSSSSDCHRCKRVCGLLPPLGAGIFLMMLAPLLVRRVAPGLVIGAGLAVAAAGFAVVSQVSDDAGLPIVVGGTAMVFAGLMPVAALGVDVVVNAVPPQRTGAASAISETTQELGFALGVALLGSIGTAVYRRGMTDTIPPDTPTHAADAARDTLGGATDAADQLPPGLLAAAGQAYTDGLQAAAAASAFAMTAAAIVAATILRRTPTRPDPVAETDTVPPRREALDEADGGVARRGLRTERHPIS
jgi:DHA2 family multidrug resistance protein-like MFS transporter